MTETPELYLLALAQFAIAADTEVVSSQFYAWKRFCTHQYLCDYACLRPENENPFYASYMIFERLCGITFSCKGSLEARHKRRFCPLLRYYTSCHTVKGSDMHEIDEVVLTRPLAPVNVSNLSPTIRRSRQDDAIRPPFITNTLNARTTTAAFPFTRAIPTSS